MRLKLLQPLFERVDVSLEFFRQCLLPSGAGARCPARCYTKGT
jgi:hypothetical protein